MNKQKKPCICGHKASKHDRQSKSKLPFFDRVSTRFFAKPYKEISHKGFCHVDNCDCHKFKENVIQ